jgi:hypothetical protein
MLGDDFGESLLLSHGMNAQNVLANRHLFFFCLLQFPFHRKISCTRLYRTLAALSPCPSVPQADGTGLV